VSLRWIDRHGMALVLGLPILWIVCFMLVPYAVLLTYSFWIKTYPLFEPAFQFGNYLTLFSEPQYVRVIGRTLMIATLVSIAALVLAYPFAYFLVFRLRNSTVRTMLFLGVIAPLWVSYLLRAYLWKTILGTEGVLNSTLVGLGIVDEPLDVFLYSQTAMVITLTYIFIPFMVMPIYAALEKIPKNLDEASADLGVGPWNTFWRVTVPLSLPGVMAGMTLTFCLCFGDFVAAFLVGGPDGLMVANVITSQFGAALNWPLGSALAVVMLAVVLTIISLSDRFEQRTTVRY